MTQGDKNQEMVNKSSDDVEQNRGASSKKPSIDEKEEKENKSKTWGKLLFCFLGLQFSYIIWGIVQENLMTREYSFGKFTSSSFCVFANRFLALIISLLIVFIRRAFAPPNQVVQEAPFYYYAPSSLSNTLSSWAQYEALKYISFPTQVLSKSCKIIPVMLVSLLC